MGFPAALAEWEKLRTARDEGVDAAANKRTKRAGAAAGAPNPDTYTVKQLCRDYLVGYLEPTRKVKSPVEVQRTFKTLLGPIDKLPAVAGVRSSGWHTRHASARYTAAQRVGRRAWDYALDAGRLPPDTANWWCLVLRGKLRTARRMLASLGCPDEVGEAILCHVLPGVVGVYNKYGYDEERRHWLTLLSQRLEDRAVCRPAK